MIYRTDLTSFQWFIIDSVRTAFYLLPKNYYDNYCCHGGKTNEHYFLADLTTVQALHSSHQSLCMYVYIYIYIYIYMYVIMVKINRVHIVMEVKQIHNHSSVMHITDSLTWPVI